MPVPYTFATATTAIPLSQLDNNFATAITLGNTAIQLGNTVTTLNNMTLANVTISSGTVSITNVAVTTANVSGTANISTLVVVGNSTMGGNVSVGGNVSISVNTSVSGNASVTGNVSAAGGSFSSVTSSGDVTLSGGTANGVLYLNGSKVATSGSALTFDGSNFLVGSSTTNGYKMGVVTSSAASTLRNGFQVSDYVTTDVNITLNNGVGGLFVGNGQSMAFGYNNTTEAMRLTSTGLGIGTSSPVEKVQSSKGIAATGANQSVGSLNGFVADYSSGASRLFASRNGVASSTLELWTTDSGGAANKNAILDSSGNLGLGVTPSAWNTSRRALQIGGSSGGYVTADNGLAIASNYAFTTADKFVGNGYAPLYFMSSSNGQHQWFISGNNVSGAGAAWTPTQAMTLDAGGNLLVGATSSAVGYGGKGFTVYNATFPEIKLIDSDTGGSSTDGTSLALSALDFIINNRESANIILSTANTERARIDSSGQIIITGSASQPSSSVKGINLSPDPVLVNPSRFSCGSATGSITQIEFINGNGLVGSISTSGSLTSYNVTSDQRLKENIADADSASTLIDSLQVRKFDWKADGNHQRYGFVAQELVTVAPEAVHQPADPEQMMAVDYSKLVPMLVKEIQSLRARVAQLESN